MEQAWLVCLLLAVTTAAAAPQVSFRKLDDSVALVSNGAEVWRFNFGANTSKPCFHPLALPGGPVLTGYEPADHPWHRGLWFSWKYINGINYWEEDRTTRRSEGATEWTAPELALGEDGSAGISLELTYRPWSGVPVLSEKRVIRVSPPAEDGSYTLDWTQIFTALDAVELQRTPLPGEPGGAGWGGYAGLSMRFVQGMEPRTIVATEALPEPVPDFLRIRAANAMDYHGGLAGRTMGVAMLDHPDNLHAPSPWYAIRSHEMTFFSPAVICFEPHRMQKDETVTLRYRVIVHPGAWTPERLNAEHRRFVEQDGSRR